MSTFGGKPLYYEIEVQGLLEGHSLQWFPGMEIRQKRDTTILCGMVQDAAALYGLIARARDLGLTLVSVVSKTPGKITE